MFSEDYFEVLPAFLPAKIVLQFLKNLIYGFFSWGYLGCGFFFGFFGLFFTVFSCFFIRSFLGSSFSMFLGFRPILVSSFPVFFGVRSILVSSFSVFFGVRSFLGFFIFDVFGICSIKVLVAGWFLVEGQITLYKIWQIP